MNIYEKALNKIVDEYQQDIIKRYYETDMPNFRRKELYTKFDNEFKKLRELVDKEKPMEPIKGKIIPNSFEDIQTYYCKCGRELSFKDNYCGKCGQKLDWGIKKEKKMNEEYQELLKEIDSARHIDTLKRFVIDIEEYCFSILTASRWESSTLGTVEMAILKNRWFVDFDDSDNSIIHYMNYESLKRFVAELENTKKEDLEKLFQKYKEENEK